MHLLNPTAPILLPEEEHAHYLTALTSCDAVAVKEFEEKHAIVRQGGAPWIDCDRRIWVRKPAWDHGGRTLLSDAHVPARIEGRPGPYKIEIARTERPVLFGIVYSLSKNPPLAWGTLMVFRRSDMLAFAKTPPDWHAFAVAQPDTAASNARAGGLRPVATIIDTVPHSAEDA